MELTCEFIVLLLRLELLVSLFVVAFFLVAFVVFDALRPKVLDDFGQLLLPFLLLFV